MKPLKILMVAAEMAPLVKVGGLGDVMGALPEALTKAGHDVRVLLPAYSPQVAKQAKPIARARGFRGRLLAYDNSQTAFPVWLLETTALLRRAGRPYLNRAGKPWADNPVQFSHLSRMAAQIAAGELGLDWQPDLVHCNDWHTGLVPVWMRIKGTHQPTIFTIHNLAYQGRFPASTLQRLGLPEQLYDHEALEFYGDVAFIKGGLVFADRLTTVSPGYAREIQTPAFGVGLDGLLRARSNVLSGILNGIDTDTWNPASDPFLRHHYHAGDIHEVHRAKQAERRRLKRHVGILHTTERQRPLLASVGRLTHQKGTDVLISSIEALMERDVELVVLGDGDRAYCRSLRKAANHWPDRIAVECNFNEALAHQIYAAADILLMPSRFEPCGLAQLCAMRYATLPLVSPVGGLVDTVIDHRKDPANSTGFFMTSIDKEGLVAALDRALTEYQRPAVWHSMQANAMQVRCDWAQSVAEYEMLYHSALANSQHWQAA